MITRVVSSSPQSGAVASLSLPGGQDKNISSTWLFNITSFSYSFSSFFFKFSSFFSHFGLPVERLAHSGRPLPQTAAITSSINLTRSISSRWERGLHIMVWYTNINCVWEWRLKYIHKVKDWIVTFHEPVGEWNGQFIVTKWVKTREAHGQEDEVQKVRFMGPKSPFLGSHIPKIDPGPARNTSVRPPASSCLQEQ